MTIYVDQFPETGWGKWGGGGHMLTTDIDELHEMAAAIGLKKQWFQDKRFPHYDMQASKRRKAIARGAVEIGFGEIPHDILVRNRDGNYETYGKSLFRRMIEAAMFKRITDEAV